MLVNAIDLLKEAERENKAIGAFNVTSYTTVKSIVAAAEEMDSPIILQYAPVHEVYLSMEDAANMMLYFAKKAKVPVAVHLDHGDTFENCMRAIKLGFTSIMYDASTKDFETNLAETKEIVKVAHAFNVSVEAELGSMLSTNVGDLEGGVDAAEVNYTDPNLAKTFVEETQVDFLAVSFGTAHGIYVNEPVLDIERVKLIRDNVKVPLVMHGGSGVSESDVKKVINNGIRKINYYTYMANKGRNAILESDNEEELLIDDLNNIAYQAMKNDILKTIGIFNNK